MHALQTVLHRACYRILHGSNRILHGIVHSGGVPPLGRRHGVGHRGIAAPQPVIVPPNAGGAYRRCGRHVRDGRSGILKTAGHLVREMRLVNGARGAARVLNGLLLLRRSQLLLLVKQVLLMEGLLLIRS